jgi:hypothetical protein
VPKNWSSSSPGTRALCSRSGGKTSGAAEGAAQSGGLRTPPDLAGTADSPRRRSEFRLLHGVCRAVADSVPPDSQDGLVYYAHGRAALRSPHRQAARCSALHGPRARQARPDQMQKALGRKHLETTAQHNVLDELQVERIHELS